MSHLRFWVFIALLGCLSAPAREEKGGDGCFAMYLEGVAAPVICVSGSLEEGIGGAAARIALVDNQKVIWCGKTTSLKDRSTPRGTDNKRTYYFDKKSGMISVEFDGALNDEGRQEGDIALTEVGQKVEMKYLELLKADAAKLPKVFESKACKDANSVALKERGSKDSSELVQTFTRGTYKDSDEFRFEVRVLRLKNSKEKTRFDVAYAKRNRDGSWTAMKVVQSLFSDKDPEAGYFTFGKTSAGSQYLKVESNSITEENAEASFSFMVSAEALSEIEGIPHHSGYFASWSLLAIK